MPTDPPGSSPLTRGKRLPCLGTTCRSGLIPAHAGKTNPPRREGGKPQGSSPLTRGKHLVFGAPRYRAPGSSPLTRGKLRRSHVRPRAPRLIPAHAGKTRGCASLPGLSRAHPRSRGENAVEGLLGQVGMGSSPLTRGKPERSTRQTPSHGLIPAHAGKTTTSMRSPKTSRAHPRSRGENDLLQRVAPVTQGSSPLTRGKRLRTLLRQYRDRLIPAHAGKTSRRRIP